MPDERPIEPAIAQRMEEVRDELRTEQRALEPLPQEKARLQEQLDRLQARKQELQREVEALRAGPPVEQLRLPGTLTAPFKARVQRSLRDPLLALLSIAVFASTIVFTEGGPSFWRVAVAASGICAALLLVIALRPPRWRFAATHARLVGIAEQAGTVTYKEITDVQVLVTPSQRRRGVGTVVVTCQGNESPRQVLIRDVPEPDRLAEWLNSQRGGTT